MNKTIYIRDEDTPVWDRARELAGDKLSPVIVDSLKRFIAQKEREELAWKGFERIELGFLDADDHGMPKRKAFMGQWIIPPDKAVDSTSDDPERSHLFAVARTAKGAFVIYSWYEDMDGESPREFTVFQSLAEAAATSSHNYAAVKAIEILGVPIEELDI
jgi:hypothetical protein